MHRLSLQNVVLAAGVAISAFAGASGPADALTDNARLGLMLHSPDLVFVAQRRPSAAQIQMMMSGQVPQQYQQSIGGGGNYGGGGAVDVQGSFNGSGSPSAGGGGQRFPTTPQQPEIP